MHLPSIIVITRIHKWMLLELPEQDLVEHQHRPALHARPHHPRSQATEPSRNSFCSVYQLQTGEDRRGVKDGRSRFAC